MQKLPPLPYDPYRSPRELKRHYISATEEDIHAMLAELGLNSLEDLYAHVPKEIRMESAPAIPAELSYTDLLKHMQELAAKNHPRTSFIGDGLQHYKTATVVPHILGIRNLTTAYTPYQPERSQGTLTTLWIYQCAVSALTGFEAINASLYDRSTAAFEAIRCAQRLLPGTDTALVCGSLYPADIRTIQTIAAETGLRIVVVNPETATGRMDSAKLRQAASEHQGKVAALVFPQSNAFGALEDVDMLTELAQEWGAKAIAVVDPILLARDGLKPPSRFGKRGADMFVAEGQHLAIAPNFGGPGLGIFGIRYNEQNRNDIRQTAGRYIGRAKDIKGRDCFSIVLSTREQHIRRDKATSNICSNQSYLATVAGAALLEKGDAGLHAACSTARANMLAVVDKLSRIPGMKLAFPATPFWNEAAFELSRDPAELIKKGSEAGLHIGVDISGRAGIKRKLLLISCSDMQSSADVEKLAAFFAAQLGAASGPAQTPATVPTDWIRKDAVAIPRTSVAEIQKYYDKLGAQNVSPDDNIYALGSCTMKYNPYINDYAAALPGFADLHPEAPLADSQGALEILFHTQEYFKAITGLAAVTTQPMAGAQGELVGLKMFQAYHRHKGDAGRDIVLIPRSAHGTNPATATMAGFTSENIALIEADETGQMNLEQVRGLVEQYGKRICGIMVTNPNTSGVLETNFKKVADLVHSVGGLVYMDGANMNAIAGWVDLGKMGVDAVHNNTHKTWSIPHGGGGPGDAFVAVSAKLVDFLPGVQAVEQGGHYSLISPKHSMGVVQRHFGNFAHKVRCYTYLRALGKEGVRRMSAVAVLSARYLHHKLAKIYPTLPVGAESTPRMHEFILTLSKEDFAKVEAVGIIKAQVIPRIGKLFLDFGLHAPTVAFPEVFGLMVEPTESYSKAELDRFTATVKAIHAIVSETPEVLQTVPHFTPIDRVDEVLAHKNLVVSEILHKLPAVLPNREDANSLSRMDPDQVWKRIVAVHGSQA